MWNLCRYALTFVLMPAITGALCRFSGREPHFQKKAVNGKISTVHHSMNFKNPLRLKISICAGMFIPPVLATGALYLAYEAAIKKIMVPLFLFIAGFIFLSCLTLRRTSPARFINAEISITDTGIAVTRKNRSTFTRWHQIRRTKNSPHFQLYAVYNQANKAVLVVDHSMPGFEKLKENIESNIGTKPETTPHRR